MASTTKCPRLGLTRTEPDTDRQTDRQTDRHTNRHRQTTTDRQTETKTDRQRHEVTRPARQTDRLTTLTSPASTT
eukprot:3249952-Rhodomonas_salina.2